MTKEKTTTFAQDLAVEVQANRDKKDKEKKQAKNRLMQMLLSEVVKRTKHSSKLGQDVCEIHFPTVYESDPEMKDTVILDFRRELVLMGFNQRDVVWVFHEEPGPANENGKHLVLRLAWHTPLTPREANDLLHPPECAS